VTRTHDGTKFSLIKNVASRLFPQTTQIRQLSRVQAQRIYMRCQHGNCLEADTALLQSDPYENQWETTLLPCRTEPLQSSHNSCNWSVNKPSISNWQ